MKANTSHKHRYTIGAILFHWVSAFLIIFMLGLGLLMKRGSLDLMLTFELYQLHKSIGITLFVVTLLRLAWRLTHIVPEYKIVLTERVKRTAVIVHWALYALLLCVPLSGWMLVSSAKLNIPTLYFGLFQIPHIPFLSENAAAFDGITHLTHTVLAFTVGILAIGHIAAALVHALIFKDGIIKRMLPTKINTDEEA